MEKKIEKYLVQSVEQIGGLCVKFPPLFFRGFPDRIVLLPDGLVVFVELKAPGKNAAIDTKKSSSRINRFGLSR